MKMSDTVLGTLNSKLNALLDKPKSSFRDFANEQRNLARSEHLAKNLRNPTGLGGALAARFAQERAKRSDRQRRADDDIQMLTNEQLIARKLGTRIIGYSKSGKPIYSSRPITGTKEMYEEFKHRETKLRTATTGQQLENTMGALGTYLQQHQIDHSALTELVEHQAQNYLDSETEKSVAKRNALSDKRFYFKQVQEAAKAGPGTAAYRNLIDAAGADFHVPSHLTGAALAEAQKASLDATTSVIADAYDMFEAERRMTTAKYTTYLDKQVTKNVFGFYDEMLKTKNVDGVVAAQNVIAIRGDYDQIHKKLGQYLDQEGYLELAEDFTNTLALNLMGMKDEDPALARLGKHINVETWQYTSGKRKSNYVTLKEFFTGVDSTGRLTKFNVRQLMRGTNLNKIDRTFYGGLLDNMNAYFTAENFDHDTDAAKDARIELLTGMLPQIIGALPSFTSGSEQIINTMSFLTGMKYDNEKNEWVVNPEETPERSQESFLMTENYLNALTPNDLINMKTDAFNAVIAKLTAHHNGDKFAAIGRFREIAENNNNIERLKTADSSALTTMKRASAKPSAFKPLHIHSIYAKIKTWHNIKFLRMLKPRINYWELLLFGNSFIFWWLPVCVGSQSFYSSFFLFLLLFLFHPSFFLLRSLYLSKRTIPWRPIFPRWYPFTLSLGAVFGFPANANPPLPSPPPKPLKLLESVILVGKKLANIYPS